MRDKNDRSDKVMKLAMRLSVPFDLSSHFHSSENSLIVSRSVLLLLIADDTAAPVCRCVGLKPSYGSYMYSQNVSPHIYPSC